MTLMSSGTVAVLGAHATVDIYIYIYIYPPHPRLRGEPGVLKSVCKFLLDLEGLYGVCLCRRLPYYRHPFWHPKLHTPQISQKFRNGLPKGPQTEPKIVKINKNVDPETNPKAGTKNITQKVRFGRFGSLRGKVECN
jgi:hypothetical protein